MLWFVIANHFQQKRVIPHFLMKFSKQIKRVIFIFCDDIKSESDSKIKPAKSEIITVKVDEAQESQNENGNKVNNEKLKCAKCDLCKNCLAEVENEKMKKKNIENIESCLSALNYFVFLLMFLIILTTNLTLWLLITT